MKKRILPLILALVMVASLLSVTKAEAAGSATGQQIVDHLREIARMGTAVLMATHNTQIVEQYPARVLRCDNKQLISE